MSLPCYKIIHLNSIEPRMIVSQLSKLNFYESPIVLNIEHLEDKQSEAIEYIDDYFVESGIDLFPYSVYVIGDCPFYTGKIFVAKDKASLPQFFNQKTKILNVKENSINAKVNLKKQKFLGIKSSVYKPVIKEYGRTHKRIYQLQREMDFLNTITTDLEKYFEQEEK